MGRGWVLFDCKEPAASIDRLLLLPPSLPSPQERESPTSSESNFAPSSWSVSAR